MKHEFQSTEETYKILNDLPSYVESVRIVGCAKRYDNEDHFVLRLRVLPTLKYFLKENDDDSEKFTVFSGKSFDSRNNIRFYYPVGFAEKLSDEFIKLKIHDLGLICYLQLKPFEKTLISPAA
ncbi:MAG: hypothetical protein ACK5V3_04395 [Bdellovibrionales bacterium]